MHPYQAPSEREGAIDLLAAALRDRPQPALDLPICTEHQREIAFCGTCLADHADRQSATLLAYREIARRLTREAIGKALHAKCSAYNVYWQAHGGALRYYDDHPWDEIPETHRESHRSDADHVVQSLGRLLDEATAPAPEGDAG